MLKTLIAVVVLTFAAGHSLAAERNEGADARAAGAA